MRCVWPLFCWLSSTRRIMRAIVLSDAGRVIRMRSAPSPFTVPAKTPSPTVRCTGTLSPVIGDWSMLDEPSSTTPSTGSRSPGATRTTSPARSASTGSSCSTPWRTTRANFGVSCPSARMALRARSVANPSRPWPSENRNRSIAPSPGRPSATAPSAATSISMSTSSESFSSCCTAWIVVRHPPVRQLAM